MLTISPDIKFKKALKKISGSSLNDCMQCGSCSVVCSLAPDDDPFPRKEMVWAGWGLKDKLIGNADIWLCHQCGDCSTACPRGVKPADVFSAIRQESYNHYTPASGFSKPAMLPLVVLAAVVIIGTILALAGTLKIPEGDVNYSRFFPHAWLNASFTILIIIVYGGAFFGIRKFWKDIGKQYEDSPKSISFISSLWKAIGMAFLHKKFNQCEGRSSSTLAHMMVSFGFLLLILVTIYAIFATITHNYPLTLFNPFKILGNLAGIMLIVGLVIMILNRLLKKQGVQKSNYTDWFFLLSLLLLTLSGFLVEMGRFMNWEYAYHIYFFHLLCVWVVIIYLPYTKFVHLIYRLLAMTYSIGVGRI